MKQITSITLAFAFLMLSSCAKFLDQVPQEILTEKTLFSNKDNLVKVLTQAYSFPTQSGSPSEGDGFLPQSFYSESVGVCGGEATYIWTGYHPYRFDNNTYSQSNNIFYIWKSAYTQIRTCHYFLANVDKCQDAKLSEQEKIWWKGEATFLLGYYYFLLLQEYGPTPIVDPATYSGDGLLASIDKGVPRPTFDEQVKYIDDLLVDAASKLDLSYQQSYSDRAARANAVAAKFLRARMWTYAASPLYNGQINPTSGAAFPHLMIKGKDGKNLLSATADASKWAKAVDVCKDAMAAAAQAGYRMITISPSDLTIDTGNKAYKRNFMFPRGGDPSPECIYYLQSISTTFLINHTLPLSWAGWSGICPTQKHVDEYFTAKGLLTDDDNDWKNATGFYTYSRDGFNIAIYRKFTKRDPRFYCNILFPGQYSYAMLDGRTESTASYWAKHTTASKNWFQPWFDGQDGYGARSGEDYSINGYLCCKWIPTNAAASSRGDNAIPVFRYSELVLNLIESAFENAVAKGVDPLSDNDVFTNWDRLRDRVGLPHVKDAYAAAGIPLTINKLRELIHTERRVELAFEGSRYFDNRRWLDAAASEGGPRPGFSVLSNKNGGFWDQREYANPVFYDKKYFIPIPQDEIDKNPALSQNPLW